MNAIELGIFASHITAICDEMGAVLQRASLSTNIKDRLDFSCAVFDSEGLLCAQAAHIPVHLGSMAFAMADVVSAMKWQAGDMVILNDPFLGGTHLPDVTLIAPLFIDGQCTGFVANRAHHADIGASAPGSMPVSRHLDEEGTIIPPTHIMHAGTLDDGLLQRITGTARNARLSYADYSAQISANRCGIARLTNLITSMGASFYREGLDELNAYAERMALDGLSRIPDGDYRFRDVMDDDGAGSYDIPIEVHIHVDHGHISVDFSGTAPQVKGNINCPLSVAAASVFYVFRCLMPDNTPACAGSLRPIRLTAPPGCLLNAQRPAAVTAGNVETSTRIVDVITGALAAAMPDAIPAASHGSMNNVAMGSAMEGSSARNVGGEETASAAWDYYETLGGGMGAGPAGGGISAVQTHMTNTRNTPVESLELHFPLRIRRYAIRDGSGGDGHYPGGDGLIREYEFLEPARVSLLTERRMHAPWGLADGKPGLTGENLLNGQSLPPKGTFSVNAGDRLEIRTPGGGGWGKPAHKGGKRTN